jgi:hypothetical protein
MSLGDLADSPAPNIFAQKSVTLFAMSLIAHLGGDLIPAGHLAKLSRLGDIVADRFFAINSLAQLHREHGRDGMLMVWRGNEYCVDLLADFIEHPPVISEDLQFIRVLGFVFKELFYHGVPPFIDIDNANQVLAKDAFKVRLAAPTATNEDPVQRVARTGCPKDVGNKRACGKRARSQSGALQKQAAV